MATEGERERAERVCVQNLYKFYALLLNVFFFSYCEIEFLQRPVP